MAKLTDLLDDIEARAEAATPGPWVEEDKGASALVVEGTEGYSADGSCRAVAEEVYLAKDRAFIAHARTDVPQLVAALRAVRELHLPVPGYKLADDCPHTNDGSHAYFRHVVAEDGFEMCLDMPDPNWTTCVTCRDIYGNNSEWPCPTVQAIASALGVAP